MKYTYQTKGVCAKQIVLDIENGVIASCKFVGGCHGNTQGVASLVCGMNVNEVIDRLDGIDCRGRGTSCPDQLAKALQEYMS